MKNLGHLVLFIKTLKLTTSEDITIQELKKVLLPFNLGPTRLVETKFTFYRYIETSSINSQHVNDKYFYRRLENVFNYSSKDSFHTLFSNPELNQSP